MRGDTSHRRTASPYRASDGALGRLPLTAFFNGTAGGMYDVGVFSSLTFVGPLVSNIANLLSPGTYDLNMAATPVAYSATGLNGYPACTTNGTTESGAIATAGFGLAAGDVVAYHLVMASAGAPTGGGAGWWSEESGDRLRHNAVGGSAIMTDNGGASSTVYAAQNANPHADEMWHFTSTANSVRRDGAALSVSADNTGLPIANPVLRWGRNGGQYEPNTLSVAVWEKITTGTNAENVARANLWLYQFVHPRFPAIVLP